MIPDKWEGIFVSLRAVSPSMSTFDQAVETYRKKFEAWDQQNSKPLQAAREQLAQVVYHLSHNSETAEVELSRLQELIRVVEAKAADNDKQSFELGFLAALLDFLQIAREQQIVPASNKIMKNTEAVRALRMLTDNRPKSASELALLMFPERVDADGRPNSSARSTITRMKTILEKEGLTVSMRSGRERLLKITESGRKLINLIAEGQVRGISVAAPSRPFHWEVPIKEKDFRRPNEDWDDRDRTKFHLYLGALQLLREVVSQRKPSGADEFFCESLLRFPLRRTELKDDMTFFRSLADIWPVHDSVRRDLLHCLYIYQSSDDRAALIKEMLHIGNNIKDGSALALLWAPAAINIARRVEGSAQRNTGSFVRDLLDRVHALLNCFDHPFANHWQGLLLKQEGKSDIAIKAWKKVSAANPNAVYDVSMKPSGSLESLEIGFKYWERQLPNSALCNMQLERNDDPLRHSVGLWVVSRFPESKPYLEGRGQQWARELSEWSCENRSKVAEAVREGLRKNDTGFDSLRESLLSLGNVIHQAEVDKAPHSKDFSGVIQRHLRQVDYVAKVGETVETTVPLANPETCEEYVMNNFWSASMVWLDTAANFEEV